MSTSFSEDPTTGLGGRLRRIRKTLGLTQRKFAEPIGISGSYISDIEKGKARPSSAVLQLLEIRYRINRGYLVSGDGPMFHEAPPAGDGEPAGVREGPAASPYGGLDRREARLLRLFRGLSPRRRQEVLDHVTDLFLLERGGEEA
ncbi:helix-turn-helix transcriptional regulator [Dissulfurirhabdus thermomarina]|uniref:Helix-turn-helix transcriptional regulator n=1 Tax=Dissulfurirhabdus thermomarina TaxID=1765737 RepID=A0A6N9TT27_DISTH|nr:helix-turn-helix transcriptional regulator [Dissulfurirhabdus thermomarina]NDY42894.1 helix-turn-helix transcriptional regulator [Dissulfurirhabdus thermomarina]NMX24139.1 helix-turn-helix transcriptional regulator [Dissulfurirhabdus thermomarina]